MQRKAEILEAGPNPGLIRSPAVGAQPAPILATLCAAGADASLPAAAGCLRCQRAKSVGPLAPLSPGSSSRGLDHTQLPQALRPLAPVRPPSRWALLLLLTKEGHQAGSEHENWLYQQCWELFFRSQSVSASQWHSLELPVPPALLQGQNPFSPKQNLGCLQREILGIASQEIWSCSSPRSSLPGPCFVLCLDLINGQGSERGRFSLAGSCAQLLCDLHTQHSCCRCCRSGGRQHARVSQHK